MWIRLLWTFALIWILVPSVARSQEATPLLLDGALGTLPLNGRLEWLEDPRGSQSLNDVQQSRAWQRLPGHLHVGFTSSAIWVRLTVKQPQTAATDWVLVIDGTQIDEAVLHAPTDLTTEHVQRAGRQIPHVQWPMNSRTPAFRLRLTPGEHQLYLRLTSEHTLSNEIRLSSVDAFHQTEKMESLFFGAFFGVYALALILQVLFGGPIRHTTGAWYLAYTLTLGLAGLNPSGYLQSFVFAAQPLPVALLSLVISLALVTLTRMCVEWLQLNQALPRFSRWYQFGMTSLAVCAGAWMLLQGSQKAVEVIQLALLAHTILALGMSVHFWRQGSSQAGYYILIFGVVELAAVIRFARNEGLLPVHFLTDYALFIGIALHVIMMSVYLIVRFRNVQEALAIEQRTRTEQREFVGMVSHEFKTPLAIISTSVQQLAANLNAPQDKVQERASNIRQAVRRMERLLNDYLSVERLDTAHQPMRLVATDFFEVIEEAVTDWPLERIRLQVDELPEPWVCDPDMIRIVLRNLLENADRHAPPHTRIDLTVRSASDGSLRLSVRDIGEGVPPDEQPKLFQKFFRGRASQGTPGAGLGLYLVARIVAAHHGQISVDSTIGQGTCFIVHLPAMKLPV